MTSRYERFKAAIGAFASRNERPSLITMQDALRIHRRDVQETAEIMCEEFEREYPASHLRLNPTGVRLYIQNTGDGEIYPNDFLPTIGDNGLLVLTPGQRAVYLGLADGGYISAEQFTMVVTHLAWLASTDNPGVVARS